MKSLKVGIFGVAAGLVLLSTMMSVPQQAAANSLVSSWSASPLTVQGSVTLSVEPSLDAWAGPSVAAGSSCPRGMVDVEGEACAAVEQTCLRWVDPEAQTRCAEFAPASKCRGAAVKKHFCIDEYEYPNQVGAKPVVMTTWNEAKATCEGEGKRLCGSSEWTLACEGQDRLPYPYGYARSSEACNIDRDHPAVDEAALATPSRRDAEVARLDQREPSGARASCVSPYGVHDMTGNVDEWVVNESGAPHKSALKGGYWGPVRDRCRPTTTAHNESFSYYQIGFRCCADLDQPPS